VQDLCWWGLNTDHEYHHFHAGDVNRHNTTIG